MKKLLFILCMLGLVIVPRKVQAESSNCVPASFQGHSYKVFTDTKNWEDAQAACESIGGHLVTITSAEEMNFVRNLKGMSDCWIGLKPVNSSWRWVTGEVLDYTNWSRSISASTNYRGIICYTSSVSSSDYGKWTDEYYSYSNKYICEWDGVVSSEYHNMVKDDSNVKKDDTSHYISYKCKDCGKTKTIGTENHEWQSTISNCKKVDTNYHTRTFKCKTCEATMDDGTAEHEWPSYSYDYVKINDSTHGKQYKCRYCDAVKVEDPVSHNWSSYSSDHQAYNQTSHKDVYECYSCDAKKTVLVNHDWMGYGYTYQTYNQNQHKKIDKCYICGTKKNILENHEWEKTDIYAKYNQNTHKITEKCKHCGTKRTVLEAHYLWEDGYSYYDATSHKRTTKCMYCGQSGTSVEKHDHYDSYGDSIYDSKYYNSTYHRRSVTCDDCNKAYYKYEKHTSKDNQKKVGKEATYTKKGTIKYLCDVCDGTLKTKKVSWKRGTNYSVSYDVSSHSTVYYNSTSVKIKLRNVLKGSVVKLKVGGKTYKKKVGSSKTVKIKIKKPKTFAKNISITVHYKGKKIGVDDCYDCYDKIMYAKSVRVGMTKKQVEYTVGWESPSTINTASGGWEYWHYSDYSYVYFKNGKVKYWYVAG